MSAQNAPSQLETRLRQSGLRLTSQRLALCSLLFGEQHRHVTAEALHEEATHDGLPVSLATVYNTLHQLVAAGLVRQVTVGQGRSYFDTNTSDHHHYFYEDGQQLEDIPVSRISVALDGVAPQLADGPDGHEIASVDVIVRLRKKR